MKKIKIGVIGTGHIVSIHLANLKKNNNFIIVGVFGTNKERVFKKAEEFKVKAYSDYDNLLHDCDALLVANAPGDHLEYAIKAAKEGKHVLIEKPIGTDLDKAMELINLCSQNNLKLAVNFQCRATKQIGFLYDLYNKDRFGKIFYANVNVDWSQSNSYYKLHPGRNDINSAGGGIFINQAIHYIDLALMFINDEIQEVRSFCDTKKHETTLEDTGVAIIKFRGGSFLNIMASNACYNGRKNKLSVYSSKGSFQILNNRITELEFKKNNLKEKIYYKFLSLFFKVNKENFGDYPAIIENFYQAITNNENLVANGNDGYRSLEVIKKIYSNCINNR